ncbi:hypothetical protein [Vibrio crassostreae]|uniref:hypothetical protein n=1 Tax=Vibrio crassostreae TaxID=246167 RepID=UPI001BD4329F|nr:hypothetical protein [Vibrio crassostreae]
MINLSTLRLAYKSVPQQLLSPLTYIPYSLFCGDVYRKKYKELNEILDVKTKEMQHGLLLDYVNESICYTKFYKDFAKSKGFSKVTCLEQVMEFPVISKDDVDSNLDWFLDSRYKNKSFSVSTGGTTGRQTKLLMSNDAFSIEWAFVARYLSNCGVDINTKRLCLRGSDGINSSALFGYNHLYKEMLISPFRLTENNIINAYGEILKYNAEWIHGYPSSVSEFARILKNLDLKIPSVKKVLLVSEKLNIEQELIIRDVFDCDVITFYGMTERVIFAPNQGSSFIPNRLYGLTEEINGELVGTGFINKASRLIRYRTGDEAIVKKDDNDIVYEISALTGRWGKDFLVGNNDAKITMTALNIHSDVLSKILKYQFYQVEKGLCDLLLVPGESLNERDLFLIKKEFNDKVGDELYIEVKVVDCIPLTKRGKHRFIVSELN